MAGSSDPKAGRIVDRHLTLFVPRGEGYQGHSPWLVSKQYGLPLTKLHHAAFDAHLIGIDPDYRIHVSDRLLEIHDGPFLELGLKGIAGTLIGTPRRLEDHPDRDRLAVRFEQYKKAA
jgi:hypothetical protein